MYNKAFKYVTDKELFNTLKVSASKDDSSYIIGDSAITIGTPDILWENICFIEKERLIWTHGVFYNQDDWNRLSEDEILNLIPIDED